MAVPYKQNDTLLQFLQHYKAHTLQFSVKFQTSHSILHRLLQPARQTQHFFQLRHQDELWQNYRRETQLAILLVFDAQSTDKYSCCQATPHNNPYIWWCCTLHDVQH
jgi:hypothetical protein